MLLLYIQVRFIMFCYCCPRLQLLKYISTVCLKRPVTVPLFPLVNLQNQSRKLYIIMDIGLSLLVIKLADMVQFIIKDLAWSQTTLDL